MSIRAWKIGFFASLSLILACPSSFATTTTYYYTGSTFTHNDDPATFGARITGSVTFNFDTRGATTGVSGTFSTPCCGTTSADISAVNLNAGVVSADTSHMQQSKFTLNSGLITNWSIPADTTIGIHGELSTSHGFNCSVCAEFFDYVDNFVNDPSLNYYPYAVSYTAGTWSIGNPAPPQMDT